MLIISEMNSNLFVERSLKRENNLVRKMFSVKIFGLRRHSRARNNSFRTCISVHMGSTSKYESHISDMLNLGKFSELLQRKCWNIFSWFLSLNDILFKSSHQ